MEKFDHYRKQLTHALEALSEWGEKKREAEQQMAKLRQLIVANANMLPDEERDAFIRQAEDSLSLGFTDAIRRVFRAHSPRAVTPTVVRDELVEAGLDLSSQSNAMASIHSVIRRLIESGEVERYGAADLGAYRLKADTSNPILKLKRRKLGPLYGE